MKRLTTKKFIEKAHAVHGDRYDYSSVNYVNAHTHVTIICPDHGPFPQSPDSHLNQKSGCPNCGAIAKAISRRLTTEEFIEKARAVHGNRYDYSSVNYVNAHTRVTIICPDHGPFPQQPAVHISQKCGCPECGGNKRLNTETFMEKAKAVHGDRYDYLQVEYAGNKTPITIICPDHGPFSQTPTSHVHKKSGCPECGGTKQLSTEAFIEKAEAVHGDRYDYSSANYVNNRTNVTIICPDHGPFEQKPNNHIDGESGCPDCGGYKKLTTKIFIEKAAALHGNRYDYSSANYINAHTPVTIICPNHGPFPQAPDSHLNKRGCPDCGGSKQLSTEAFIEMAKAIHGNRYDYSSVNYVNAHTRVTIICPDHGPFPQTPSNHLFKTGCPDCAETGFNPNEPGLLYYLAITTDDGDTRYKIGITNYTVQDRFRGPDLARIRTIKTWRFAIGRAAAEREAEILKQHVGEKYNGPDILVSGGNTELFTHDVLGLDGRGEQNV